MVPSAALRQARRRAGLTQRQLAATVGVPQSTIARIESGAMDPCTSTLDRLLRACGEELRAVPRIGMGEDRSLPRANLQLPPAERLRRAAAAANAVRRLRWRRVT